MKFDALSEELRCLLAKLNDEPVNKINISEAADDCLQQLEESFKECKEINYGLLLVLDDSFHDNENYWFTNRLKSYNSLRSQCKIAITRREVGSTERPQNNSHCNLRIEKLKFEKFNGDLRKYRKFKDEFQRHIKPLHPAGEEAFVLRNYLEPVVKEEVEYLGEDVAEIWKRLDSKYGDNCKLVDMIMGDFKKLRKAGEKPSEILQLINTIEKAHHDLQYMGKEHEINNSTIIALIEEKLPACIESEWLQRIAGKDKERIRQNKFPALLELLLEFKERIEYQQSNLRAASSKGVTYHINDAANQEKPARKDHNHANSHPLCWLHPNQSEHPIWRCHAFQKRTPEERIQLTKEHNACFVCLQEGHYAKHCDKNFRCNDGNCNLRHHWLLHGTHVEGTSLHHGTEVNNPENHALLLIQKARASNSGWRMSDINILWDSGSTLSFITFKKAEQLKLKGTPTKLHIYKVGGELQELDSRKYKMTLQDKKGVMIEVEVMGITKISNDINGVVFPCKPKPFAAVNLNSIDRPNEGEIECLMGFDYATLHPVRTLVNGNLCLFENRFGKIVGGSHPELHRQERVEAKVHFLSATPDNFFELEQLGVTCNPRCGSCKCGKCHPGGKDMTIKEEKEFNLISDQLIYDADKMKWEAPYPWIKDPKELPNNRSAVVNALRCTEKRLKKNTLLATEYQRQIEDMLERKVCRKLTKEEMDAYKGPVYYISHHEVVKEDSQSTPMRIVFNSSANYRGHVLNDYYAKGPDMLNGMLGILLRFREGYIGFVGDIRKMYHSIAIPLVDQMTHRFLWRDLDEHKVPEDYAMTAVNFGDKPSGAMAIVALQKTAELGIHISVTACETIKCNSYMDDILDSSDTQEEAMTQMKNVDKILELGGFTTKGWTFTNKRTHQDEIGVIGTNSVEKVLGMRWDPDKDAFKFKVVLNFLVGKVEGANYQCLKSDEVRSVIPVKLTKRCVLAQLNRIYDPLGLIAPLTVKAKILMRKLWTQKEKLDWDDGMPASLREEWISLFEDLLGIEGISFMRCLKPVDAKGLPNLVIFSDGSKKAYGAAAYCHWETSDGYSSQLVASKNRVAPLKIVDIVKLELCGALLSARLRTFLEKELRLKFSRVLHIVDSEIVKAMTSKESYGFNTFTANRIGEIQRLTDKPEWYWIPGKLNIADLITHGGKAADVSENSDWQRGPAFLKQPVQTWPIRQDTDDKVLQEATQIYGISAVVMQGEGGPQETLAERIDITRFGTLLKLLNTTARILHLYKRFKLGSNVSNQITSKGVKEAETFWIKEAQKDLRKDINNKRYQRLCPRVQDDIVVVGGRAERWMQQTWNRQTFILLPKDHPFSRLMATFVHKEIGHLADEATVAAIRRKYWIIGIHKIVKGIRANCVPCKKKFKILAGQIMAELPVERLKPSPPFYTTGLDFFGPFVIKGEVQKRVRGKCFGVIFTCFVSRIVYVDISQDYSTDSFLMTLRRFATIHGWPQRIHSDQGSQLVSASNELRGIVDNLDAEQLSASGIRNGFEWSFSPPEAPWMNGVTEALVKTVKSALKTIVGDQVMTFPELQTVMFECAGLVNQRPIGKHPVNPEDGAYLCPNDLRLGRASPRIPQGPFQERTGNKHRFDFLQGVVEGFWKRWTCRVFPTLVIRSKWHVSQRNVQIGDIVIAKDANAIRGEWRLGKITKTQTDADGMVRRVHLIYTNAKDLVGRVASTEVERAVHNLVVLVPNDNNDDSNNETTEDSVDGSEGDEDGALHSGD